MNVTAEQWAQAEAERQRQAEMVQTLFNEVRRLGTAQSNNLQEIQRLRAEQLFDRTASGTHRRKPMYHHRQLMQDAESSSRLCFQVTRARGATGVSSCAPTCQWLTSNLDGWAGSTRKCLDTE